MKSAPKPTTEERTMMMIKAVLLNPPDFSLPFDSSESEDGREEDVLVFVMIDV